MGKTKMTREEFEEAILAGIKQGKIKCILVGQTVKFIAPENVKPHHYVLNTEEGLRRLAGYKTPPTLRERFLAWLRR